ncbi:hypothetical protein [Palleronia abyssalis]|uniref:Uncharacterized protein n=1 Tax=Palleronia abyssalis TaxID=1501240 RepID=A0A2R8BZ02_9RHOB|nr:hypothetical protein [Palleronia abyssalis]SPJ25316.1 hypothetical protein PAA8504_03167 [Palleronia abyssalis]
MKRTVIAAAVGLAGLAAPALAEVHPPAVFAYTTHENYCPNGLQPVTINGIVSCGTPNQPITYRQVMTHPVQRTHPPRKAMRSHYQRSTGIPLKGGDVYVPSGKGID